MGGDDPNDEAVVLDKLYHSNPELLIITEGREGCRYYTKELKGRVPAIEVNAIDTTGAGDSLVVGLLYALAADPHLHVDEERLTKALRFCKHLWGSCCDQTQIYPCTSNKGSCPRETARSCCLTS